jgi:type IV secretion system protein VirB6
MSTGCPGIAENAFLQSVLGFVDCQAQSLGALGYQALATPGSPLSLVITGLLTLFIALIGYRMLLGETPGVRDGVLALVKIGIVLALATSWPAYRTLLYDTVFHGPAELVASIGTPAGLPGATGGLVTRLELVDDALLELGRLETAAVNTSGEVRVVDGREVVVPPPAREPQTIFGATGLGTARWVFLTATIAAFASVRLLAGLLLALGPFFIAFLLFDATRGLFDGWIRALAAAMLGAVAVTLLLGVELALLEPWLAELIVRRQATLPIGGAPTELLVVMSAFALALVAGLGAAARLAVAFGVPPRWWAAPAQRLAELRSGGGERVLRPEPRAQAPAEQLSRAAAVAEAIAHVQRREAAAATGGGARTTVQAAMVTPVGRDMPGAAPAPLGQSHRRRTLGRVSRSAARRDTAR